HHEQVVDHADVAHTAGCEDLPCQVAVALAVGGEAQVQEHVAARERSTAADPLCQRPLEPAHGGDLRAIPRVPRDRGRADRLHDLGDGGPPYRSISHATLEIAEGHIAPAPIAE